MADTTFTNNSTVVDASWLNDINDHVYSSTPISPATTVHPASTISVTPVGTISSTNAQAALAELDTDKVGVAGANMTGPINDALATVAGHATNTDIWSVGNKINLTGVITYTDFPDAPQAGSSRELFPAAGSVFTNNANLSVQGGANYTAQAGDEIEIIALTTTTFKLFVNRAVGVVPGAVSFCAYNTTSQSVTSAVETQVTLQAKEWDTHNAFNTTTGTFTAPVAGRYVFRVNMRLTAGAAMSAYVFVKKSGVAAVRMDDFSSSGTGMQIGGTCSMYLAAGETIQLWASLTSAASPAFAQALSGRQACCWMEGELVA